MLNSIKTALVISLMLVSGVASAAQVCTLSHSAQGKKCDGLLIIGSDGIAWTDCLTPEKAKEAFVLLVKSSYCSPFDCTFKEVPECSDHGGYAVINQDGEVITSCETGRAAIDTFHSLSDAGICVYKGM